MDAAEKGLVMSAAIFAFLLAVTLAASMLQTAELMQKSAYTKSLRQRNVVVTWMTS